MKDNKNNYQAVIEQLPTLKNLRKVAQSLSILSALFGSKEAKKEVAFVKEELARIVDIVGGFYNLLGDRNWIFSDYLNLNRMEAVSRAATAEEAEAELINYLQEQGVLTTMLQRLNKYPDMRPRLPLLEKAANDFLEHRYYSSVLVVVSMADGFVNDVHKSQRKGLHARLPNEMATEDSVATIPVGLPSFQETFNQTVCSRIETEAHEVMRNGLVHGMLTNYDNAYIAGKAWCMLFAVCDWADDKFRNQKQNEQGIVDSAKYFLGAFKDVARIKQENAEAEKYLDEWIPHTICFNDPEENDKSAIEDIQSFFESWKLENYGRLSTYLPNPTHKSGGQMAGEARMIFSEHPVQNYSIERIERTAPSIAVVAVSMKGIEGSWRAMIRFVKFKDEKSVADWQNGTWKAMRYAVDPFEDRAETISLI